MPNYLLMKILGLYLFQFFWFISRICVTLKSFVGVEKLQLLQFPIQKTQLFCDELCEKSQKMDGGRRENMMLILILEKEEKKNTKQ